MSSAVGVLEVPVVLYIKFVLLNKARAAAGTRSTTGHRTISPTTVQRAIATHNTKPS